uniref:Variant surface glycoprotein n=1 Tax=Trypanosoma brucei TaxID=5691 RepID=A0A1V0FYM9_9TRYP|nr:variant surface glycoprotein [Trypanosoma brucei]
MAQISTTSGTDGSLDRETGSDTHRPHSDGFSGPSSGCKISTTALAATDVDTQHFTQTGYDGGLQTAAAVATNTDTGANACALTGTKGTSRLLDGQNGDTAIEGSPSFPSGLYYIHSDGMQRLATGSLSMAEATTPTLKAAHDAYLTTKYTPASYKFETANQLREDPAFRTIYAMLVKKKIQ